MAELLHTRVEPSAEFTERRRKARREFVDRLTVRDAADSVCMGRLANLASSGMLLVTDFPVRVGAVLTVHIELPEVREGRSHVDMSVQCCWCHRIAGSNGFEAGFRFVKTTFRQKHLLETVLSEAIDAGDRSAHNVVG